MLLLVQLPAVCSPRLPLYWHLHFPDLNSCRNWLKLAEKQSSGVFFRPAKTGWSIFSLSEKESAVLLAVNYRRMTVRTGSFGGGVSREVPDCMVRGRGLFLSSAFLCLRMQWPCTGRRGNCAAAHPWCVFCSYRTPEPSIPRACYFYRH